MMNRAAREHLLGLLAFNPLLLVRGDPSIDADALLAAFEGLRRRSAFVVLPPAVRWEFIEPRSGVRVVAGKGRRKRGVRSTPPSRGVAA